MRPFLYSILGAVLIFSCEKKASLSAQDIVDKTIEVSGGAHRIDKMIDFDFRDKHYKAIRDSKGNFLLQREFNGRIPDMFKDSIVDIRDVINNNVFQRYVGNFPMSVIDTMAAKYSASVNSVHYFAELPYGLNDAAVNKTSLGNETIKGKDYHKIKVTFNEEGGGEDFEDVFIYWINSETFKVDYLAYSYNEDHGLGLRFREAYNERMIHNIRFVDYNNYKPKDDQVPLEDLGKLFEKSALTLLSKIETENVVVNRLVNN